MNLSDLLTKSPEEAARGLLGWTLLVHDDISKADVGGIICETEAYLPTLDPAAHNRYGKTKANASLFASAGTLYIHPMRQHVLIDIVVQEATEPGSVLIRALQPTDGVETMRVRRGISELTRLCRGPGNVCKSLGIKRDLDGVNILSRGCPVRLVTNTKISRHPILESKRVGVSSDLNVPLRFYIGDRAFISE